LSTVQRAPRAVEIAWFLTALVASCALPSYQVEGRGDSSAAGSGSGGRGASGSDAASTGVSSASSGGSGSAGGQGGAGGQDVADAGVCNTEFGRCPDLSEAGKPCPCKGNICFVDNCDLMGGGETHGLICKPDPQNADQLIWTADPTKFACCPQNKRPCKPDLGEVCVVTEKPAGAVCATNPCDMGQSLDCAVCANKLCVEPSLACEVKINTVFCSVPMP
jgi:hypothetical protein